MSSEDHSLHIHEWIAIAAVTLAFALMGAFSWTGAVYESEGGAKDGYLWVEVEGCVSHPGPYQVTIGTTVQQVLDLSEPLPEASYKGLRRSSLVKNGQLIRVGERSWITVYLDGAVRTKGALKVRRGTRLIDLIGVAPLKKEADTNSLKRKRHLKSGERITIPEAVR